MYAAHDAPPRESSLYLLRLSLVRLFSYPAQGTKKKGPGADDRGSPGSCRRDDDAQMMSEFGRDPNADLMDTTRGLQHLLSVI